MSVRVPGDVQPEFPVVLITSPANQQASVGGTATFTVVVDGGGTVTYQWQTTNHRISLLSGFVPLPGAEGDGFWTINGATSASFTTSILQASDTGSQFQCLVKNSNTVPQSVGNLTLFQTHGVSAPFTTPQQLFSVLMTQPAILLVQ
jgi:beta-galactosidase